MATSLRDPRTLSDELSPKRRLIEIVRSLSLIEGRPVTLSSGETSNFYFDMKPTLFDPEGAALVAELMLGEAMRKGSSFVGGLEMGAVPIVACITQLSFLRGHSPVHGFFVRKAAKEHGTRKRIEGLPGGASLENQRVLVVDDVTTTGASVLMAVQEARRAGADVDTVLTIVDRLEGASANLAAQGARLISLSTARDYGISTKASPS